MVDIPEKDYDRLIKLCGLLSSDNENERSMSAMHATVIIKRYKLTWADIVAGKAHKQSSASKPTYTTTQPKDNVRPAPNGTRRGDQNNILYNQRSTFQYKNPVTNQWHFIWKNDVEKILNNEKYFSKLFMDDDKDFIRHCVDMYVPLTIREEKMLLGIIDYLKALAGYEPICQ